MTQPAEGGPAAPPQDGATDRLALGLLLTAIGLLLLVGASGPSVAAPPLGDDGWAPPSLPWRLGAWTTVALQTVAYVLGGASLVRHLRAPSPLRLRWWHLALLAVLVLLTAPFGTADHTNYAAYGRVLAEGGDPWVVVPEAFRGGADPVTRLVQPPWQDTPSVYGPVGTWLMGLAGWLGGDAMRQVVWVWQVLVVTTWLGVRQLLVAVGAARSHVDRWWTTNVLVLGAGVLGAHLDMIAVAGMLTALALGLAGRPFLAGLLTGVAASTKITAGVVALALVVGWLAARDDRPSGLPLGERLRRHATPVGLLSLGTLLVLVPTHLLASPATISQVRDSGNAVSYAMPWRLVYTALDLALPEQVARTTTVWAAAAACVALVVLLWRLTESLEAWPVPRALLVLTTAYALGAAYVLPWYELMQWASVALVAGLLATGGKGAPAPLRPLLLVLAVRGTVLALSYVPGRVRIPEDVETLTLGFRFVASPLATVLAWVVLVVMWRRSGARRTVPAKADRTQKS